MKRLLSCATFVVLVAIALIAARASAKGGSPVPPMFPSGRPDPEFLARLPKDVQVDSFGNAWVTRGSGRPHVLVLTHRDAPGYVVSQITPDGFLRLQRLGTPPTPLFDQFMVGKRMVVYTATGMLPAVVAAPSTHFRRGADLPVPEATVDDLWIDIGAESEREAAEMGVALLDPVVPPGHIGLPMLRGSMVVGYGAGVGGACQVLGALSGELPSKGSRTFAWVSGGTEGGRGSRRLLATIGPVDSVVVVEAIPAPEADTTGSNDWRMPPTRVAPGDTAHAPSREWAARALPRDHSGYELVRTLASPDARVWAAAGVPTLVLGLPTRYAGTPNEGISSRSLGVDWDRFIGAGKTDAALAGSRWNDGDSASPWSSPGSQSLHTNAWSTLAPLLRVYGVSEHESPVAKVVRDALVEFGAASSRIDGRGNVVLALGSGPPDRIFIAHMDEIGYRVTSIGGDEIARVERKGGFFDWLYEGERVRFAGRQVGFAVVAPRAGYRATPRPAVARPLNDEVRGALPAPSRFEVADVRVDAGTRGIVERVFKFNVVTDDPGPVLAVGDDITVLHEIARLGAHRLSARAIDDRYGCAALVMAAKELWPRRKSLPSTVWLVWSVEEEIGLKGAEWLADSLKKAGSLPARVHAVDTFVSSDSPLEDERYGDAKLGKGAVVRAVDTSHEAPIEAVRATLALARREDIPLQYGVTSGGNDGVPFAERGSINVPLAWPLRYSHSAVEVADLRDLEALSRIIIALSKQPATSDPNLP